MQQLFSNRWFALAEFAYAVIISGVIFMYPQWGSWLVILVLLPWLAHLVFRRISFERTAFVVPIAIFIITAGIGVWAAYDQQGAIEKLWVLLAAVAVFAVLVIQPKENLGVVAGLVGLMGVFIAIIFLFTNDWHSQSSDLELIKRAGNWIAAVRPPVEKQIITPNFAGGLLAILVPIPIAISIHYWQERRKVKFILAVGMVIAILVGLFLTSSRGAWISLLTGVGLWLLWRFSQYLAFKAKKSPWLIFGLLLLITVLPLVWIISVMPGGIVAMADRIPGLPTGGSRYELSVNTGKLIEDYPFTGGGLRSFPGQYSRYILVIPYFLYAYSHNFYLDVFFEQGLIGGFALLVSIFGAAFVLMEKDKSLTRKPISFWLSAAVITSTFVILVQGFVDDPLYGDLGSPLLLLIPGFAILLSFDFFQNEMGEGSNPTGDNTQSILTKVRFPVVLVLLVLLGILIFGKPLLASWYANKGAVEMAKSDLADWPQNQWYANPDVSGLESAQQHFNQAVNLDQSQRTAWHRSGLISAQGRDFDKAQTELERAYLIDPEHRGIKKSLGYVYAWNGEITRAAHLLEGISEAPDEMEVYAWWWRENNEPGLADQAGDLARLLELESSTP